MSSGHSEMKDFGRPRSQTMSAINSLSDVSVKSRVNAGLIIIGDEILKGQVQVRIFSDPLLNLVILLRLTAKFAAGILLFYSY